MGTRLIEDYGIVKGSQAAVQDAVMKLTEIGYQCVGDARPYWDYEKNEVQFCQTLYKMDAVVRAMLDELKKVTE